MNNTFRQALLRLTGRGLLLLAVSLLLLPFFPMETPAHEQPPGPEPSEPQQLSPAEQYAGEILAYLLKVVLGKAGNPEQRDEWRTRGLDQKLDFASIRRIMMDLEQNELQLMVLDPNILPLTKILYYYDERLSLHKGRFDLVSVYPAPEFVAIRLLLLQKLHRGEQIDLEAVMDRKDLFFDPSVAPGVADLKSTHLRLPEFQLIQDIVAHEPFMFAYLKSPFLVKALYDLGIVDRGRLVASALRQCDYGRYSCRHFCGSRRNHALKVLILPSMTKEFYHGNDRPLLSSYGFWPTEFLSATALALARGIITSVSHHLSEASGNTSVPDSRWDRMASEGVAFYIEDDRPLVVLPENGGKVVRDICADADFTVVLQGKNVYLTVHQEEWDTYPVVNRMVLDILDVEYGQAQWEIDRIGEYLADRLLARMTSTELK